MSFTYSTVPSITHPSFCVSLYNLPQTLVSFGITQPNWWSLMISVDRLKKKHQIGSNCWLCTKVEERDANCIQDRSVCTDSMLTQSWWGTEIVVSACWTEPCWTEPSSQSLMSGQTYRGRRVSQVEALWRVFGLILLSVLRSYIKPQRKMRLHYDRVYGTVATGLQN